MIVAIVWAGVRTEYKEESELSVNICLSLLLYHGCDVLSCLKLLLCDFPELRLNLNSVSQKQETERMEEEEGKESTRKRRCIFDILYFIFKRFY